MKDIIAAPKSKWDVAQQAAIDLIESVPEGRELAFLAYGLNPKRKDGPCQDVDVIRSLLSLTTADKAKLVADVKAMKPAGATPIALSLRMAGAELAKTEDLAKLILITDGMETCMGDPAEEAAQLVKKYKHLQGGVDVVGFDVDPKEVAAVARIAGAGQGKFHNAKTVKDLEESIKVIKEKIALAAPSPRGKPDGMEPGQTARWYVWYSDSGWHVRTTTKSKEHEFGGTIRVLGGQVTSVKVDKLESKGDWWKLSEGNKVLTLDLKTKGNMDGFDFQVGDKANQVVLTLLIDGKERSDLIYVGKHGAHPSGATLVLPAHPGK
jgi:hypothetical protein